MKSAHSENFETQMPAPIQIVRPRTISYTISTDTVVTIHKILQDAARAYSVADGRNAKTLQYHYYTEREQVSTTEALRIPRHDAT